MANINLLPWREEARERRKRDYLGILTLVFFSACIVIYLVLSFIDMMESQQRSRNAYLTSEIQVLESQIHEIRAITTKKKNIERRTEIILNLQQGRNLPTRVLDEIVRIIPAGIYLSKIEKKGDLLLLEGKSESNNHVSNMMRRVEASAWLQEPNMQEIITRNDDTRQLQQFRLQIMIKHGTPESISNKGSAK
ncbi:MAG: PilN domain-containing protein [Parashewanella sp.]